MDNSLNVVSTGLDTVANNTYNYVNTLLLEPSIIIILVVIVILYLALFMSLGNSPTASNDTSSSVTITALLMFFFMAIILINGLQYFFGLDIIANIKNILTGNPEVDILVDASRADAIKAPVPELLLRPQVFNIPGNTYGYQDAKALCSAYGSRLATYSEVEDAYKNGGEWCNYGWSDGQMALFPTQQKTFDNLQKIKGHEHDCGRPGINGGYIANPQVQFGVNCYGNKPKINKEEEELMKTISPYPQTKEDLMFQKRVDYWKEKVDEILVSPFNYNSWGQ